jgi:hypothetical protein
MAKRANKPKREPLVVGDVFLMPLANGMLSACRVLYKIDHARDGFSAEEWMVVGCEWTGVEPPPLDDPSLRRPLRLTHHYREAMGKEFSQASLAGPAPDGFRLLGNVPPIPDEAPPLFPYQVSWEALRANALEQWRWDHEREAVLAEDAVKAAEFEARKAELERQRRDAQKNMTYAQFREQRLFPNWGPPTPRRMIAASRKLMNETATRLEALGPNPDREAARAVLRDCILAFNRLDEENDHWIETVECEDICSHFSALAHIAGFGDEPELADEWRDW